MGWIEAIWHFLFGWPSVAVLVGSAAVALAIFTPPGLTVLVPNFRRFAIFVAVVAFSLTAIMGKFYNDGLREIKAQVNEGLAREAVQGEAARADAVRTVTAAAPSRLRNDRWNRDGKRRQSASGK